MTANKSCGCNFERPTTIGLSLPLCYMVTLLFEVYNETMYHEIERKFLIRRMPKISGIKPELQERHFIQHTELAEERIQKKDAMYEYELKMALSPREWRRERRFISEEEFKQLALRAPKVIMRESYSLSKKNPRISIKKYLGDYRGLVLAEVEFDSVAESEDFSPSDWMGIEITNTPLGRDSRLIGLDREHFSSVLKDSYEIMNPEGFE